MVFIWFENRLQSWVLMLIVVLIASGLCMFTYKSTQFNMLGFFFLLLASITSAIRWTFAQFIMQKSKLGLHNPVDMIYFMQPWMIFPLIPLSIGFEGKFSQSSVFFFFCELLFVSYKCVFIHLFMNPGEALLKLSDGTNTDTVSQSGIFLALKITCGAFIAFAMEISEFLLLSHTSSLTLAISNIFKVKIYTNFEIWCLLSDS